ncbi:MAG: hypothetical protein MK102_13780 [Fuerstiella sp.]|nr:hypothetical protein [Fuerstiella sp.]
MTSATLACAESLRRISRLEYILIGDLRDLLESPIDEQNLRWVSAVVDAILETLPKQFELKQQQGGYLQEVLNVQPNWECHVISLEVEHAQICDRLQQLRHQLPTAVKVKVLARTLRIELKGWMQAFVAHSRRESRLLQTAMNLEVGCGD